MASFPPGSTYRHFRLSQIDSEIPTDNFLLQNEFLLALRELLHHQPQALLGRKTNTYLINVLIKHKWDFSTNSTVHISTIWQGTFSPNKNHPINSTCYLKWEISVYLKRLLNTNENSNTGHLFERVSLKNKITKNILELKQYVSNVNWINTTEKNAESFWIIGSQVGWWARWALLVHCHLWKKHWWMMGPIARFLSRDSI